MYSMYEGCGDAHGISIILQIKERPSESIAHPQNIRRESIELQSSLQKKATKFLGCIVFILLSLCDVDGRMYS